MSDTVKLPDEVEQWAWDEALRWAWKGDLTTELIARALMQKRRSDLYDMEQAKYTHAQGMDAEMESFNDGLDRAMAIITGIPH